MLFLGIILTFFGIVIFSWFSRAFNQPFYNRPLIFNKTIPVLIIFLTWLSLILGGLYCLWVVNPIIVYSIIGIIILLMAVGFLLGNDRQKAKKFFKLYKQLKIYRPKASEQDILKETTKLYYQNLRLENERIESIINTIFEEDEQETKDVKHLAGLVLVMENPQDGLGSDYGLKKYTKRSEAVDKAYEQILGIQKSQSQERPELNKDTLERLKSIGLEPKEMSNEQLVALEELDNPEKSHWISRAFRFVGGCFGFLALFSLLELEFVSLLINVIIGAIFMYIGYRIQVRITNKKFMQASMLKWAEDQKTTEV